MARGLSRQDFLIKDVAISVGGGGGRGGTWMPGPDGETPPSPISPIASIVANLAQIEAVRATVLEAVKTKRFEAIGRAFVAGDAGGDPVIRTAIQEIGTAVVASAAYAAFGGGEAGLVDPNCGGTSFETIPVTTSPVVHVGLAVHRVSELPRLRKQLAQAVAYLDKAAAAQAPRSEEVPALRSQLEAALKSLPQTVGV